jgi:hypothetical protein
MTTLTLGGVVFQGFEIPESINSGGEQMLVVHKQPGGTRTIDAMGSDDEAISWSGRFRGPSAEQRALLLDFMRRAGQTVLLTYSLHIYQVVIRKFTANFQQSFEIPYSITCEVLVDETQALATAAIGLIDSLASSLVSATGLSALIPNSTINTTVTGVGTALSNYEAGVPNTTNALSGVTAAASGPLLSALNSSISTAQTATRAGITSTAGGINPTPVVSGGSPAVMASSLSSAASGMGQLSNLYQLSSTLGVMGKNTANAGN